MWPEGTPAGMPNNWKISSLDVPGQKTKRNYSKWDHEILQVDGAVWAYSLQEGQTKGSLSKEVACCFLGLLCLMKVCLSF